jgi:HlyD family secretion protein
MKRSTLISGVVAAAAVLALVAWAFAPRPVEVEVATAVRRPFETTVDEGARTRLAERYGVSAPLKARNGAEAWLDEGQGKVLADGTRVIVYPSASVHDGVAVRVR